MSSSSWSPSCPSSCSAASAGPPRTMPRGRDRVLNEGLTLTVPTTWRGETCLRFCFVNPRTTIDDVALILATLG